MILAKAVAKDIHHIAFVSPLQGMMMTRKSLGHCLLPQDVLMKDGGMLVAILKLAEDHWACFYAYLKKSRPHILIFDSLDRKDEVSLRTRGANLPPRLG